MAVKLTSQKKNTMNQLKNIQNIYHRLMKMTNDLLKLKEIKINIDNLIEYAHLWKKENEK